MDRDRPSQFRKAIAMAVRIERLAINWRWGQTNAVNIYHREYDPEEFGEQTMAQLAFFWNWRWNNTLLRPGGFSNMFVTDVEREIWSGTAWGEKEKIANAAPIAVLPDAQDAALAWGWKLYAGEGRRVGLKYLPWPDRAVTFIATRDECLKPRNTPALVQRARAYFGVANTFSNQYENKPGNRLVVWSEKNKTAAPLLDVSPLSYVCIQRRRRWIPAENLVV